MTGSVTAVPVYPLGIVWEARDSDGKLVGARVNNKAAAKLDLAYSQRQYVLQK